MILLKLFRRLRTKDIAVLGFFFSVIYASACLVAALVTSNPDFTKYTPELIGVVLTATLGSYVTRRYTDYKYRKALTEEEETE